MAVVICKECRFWEEITVLKNRGMCKRYPQAADTAAAHWCGEFSRRAEEVAPIAEQPKQKKPKEKPDVGTV